jgi:ankyrin repeat protein
MWRFFTLVFTVALRRFRCYAVNVFPSAATLGVLLWLSSGRPIAAGASFFTPQFSSSAEARGRDHSLSLTEALDAAVRAGRLDQVQQLLATGADLNAKDRVGSAPLHVVAWSGNIGIASFLISHGADVNALQSETGSTPLDYAVVSGNSAIVKLLLGAGARIDIRDRSGETALHLAAAGNRQEILELLLAAHPDLNAPDAKDKTALDEAVLHGWTSIMAVLVGHGANPSRVHAVNGRGPLHEACVKGFHELIEPLIAAGADPTQRDRFGQTPLDLALAYKNASAVAVLLRLGARLKGCEADAEHAMESATLRGQTEIASILIQGGFDINRPTEAGSTYLHDAALKSQSNMAQLLLDRGAHVDALNLSGGTPLHDAAIGGATDVIDLLLNRGAKIDVKERESGATALM